ncbi:Follistatin [Nymphon striatum]|nr:Follistatin [Nymphon striatum]
MWSLRALRLDVDGVTGHCWSRVNKKDRCSSLLRAHISREECCNGNNGALVAWSEDDLKSGDLFFWRALGGGVPNCFSCKRLDKIMETRGDFTGFSLDKVEEKTSSAKHTNGRNRTEEKVGRRYKSKSHCDWVERAADRDDCRSRRESFAQQ